MADKHEEWLEEIEREKTAAIRIAERERAAAMVRAESSVISEDGEVEKMLEQLATRILAD